MQSTLSKQSHHLIAKELWQGADISDNKIT